MTDDELKLWITAAPDTSNLLAMLLEDYEVDLDEVEAVDFDNWTVTRKAAERPLYDSEGCYFDRETL